MKKKIAAFLWPIVYFLLVIGVCVSGCMVFHSYYYQLIFVSGSSMNPTFNGGTSYTPVVGDTVDFGIQDTHDSAKKDIHRFTVVTTYYPTDYTRSDGTSGYDPSEGAVNTLKSSAYLKIKRVIAMPGETFKIEKGLLYIMNDAEEWENVTYTFDTKPSWKENLYSEKKEVAQRTLGENEYWVMGDNRSSSEDSVNVGAVCYEELVGVLIAIEGTGTIYYKYRCDSCNRDVKYTDASKQPGTITCPSCGKNITSTRTEDIRNRKYGNTKYYF